MKVFGKISRRSRLNVVLPLDEHPLIPSTIAFRLSVILKRNHQSLLSIPGLSGLDSGFLQLEEEGIEPLRSKEELDRPELI